MNINHLFCIKIKMQPNNILGNNIIKLAAPIVRPRNMNIALIHIFLKLNAGIKS